MSKTAWLTLALGALLLAACQSTPDALSRDEASAEPAAQETSEPVVRNSEGRKAPAIDPVIEERARAALARVGIPQDLKLLTVDAMEWPDSSMGCRQPGQQYLQVITRGYALRFGTGEPDAPVHTVHVSGENAVVCSAELGTGVVQRPPKASRALGLDVIVVDAREDLAKRLGLPVENVTLMRIVPMTFDDDRLACEAPPSDAFAPPVRGHQLLFMTTSGNYIYRTDGKRFAPCPPIAAD